MCDRKRAYVIVVGVGVDSTLLFSMEDSRWWFFYCVYCTQITYVSVVAIKCLYHFVDEAVSLFPLFSVIRTIIVSVRKTNGSGQQIEVFKKFNVKNITLQNSKPYALWEFLSVSISPPFICIIFHEFISLFLRRDFFLNFMCTFAYVYLCFCFLSLYRSKLILIFRFVTREIQKSTHSQHTIHILHI